MGREGKNGDINWGINTFVKRRLPHSGGVRSNSMTSRLSFLSRSSSLVISPLERRLEPTGGSLAYFRKFDRFGTVQIPVEL